MTIAKMNEHFEKAGFEVTRQYLSNERRYKFTITKNNISHTGYFVYGDDKDYQTRDLRQLNFISEMISEFHNKAPAMKDRYEKTTKDMFRHFVRRLGKTSGIEIYTVPMDDRDEIYAIKKTEFGELRKSYTIIWNEVDDLNAAYDAIVKHLADEKFWVADYTISDMWPSLVHKKKENTMKIKNVHFSGPCTVVIWEDGTKTVVRAKNETFDHEKGLAMAIAKKALGTNENRSNYYDEFKKWIPKESDDENLG